MPPSRPQPIKPGLIALICVVAVAVMFAGSIAIGVAVVKAGHAAPAPASDSQ